ncbi:MAG: hypothetical protein FWC75_05795 [Oscillospiraceae bacterium]|nr:hypothetical protein [Oscillospiraceae bacterium]
MRKIFSTIRNFNYYTVTVLWILGMATIFVFPQLSPLFILFWGLGAYGINIWVNLIILKKNPDYKPKVHKNPILRLVFDQQPFKLLLLIVILCMGLMIASFAIMAANLRIIFGG